MLIWQWTFYTHIPVQMHNSNFAKNSVWNLKGRTGLISLVFITIFITIFNTIFSCNPASTDEVKKWTDMESCVPKKSIICKVILVIKYPFTRNIPEYAGIFCSFPYGWCSLWTVSFKPALHYSKSIQYFLQKFKRNKKEIPNCTKEHFL